ncbi:Rieske (2Fe-2S) protein [Cysteiniphilum litorale]|uniref:Rieske (2Fe-2S) protein n=1 Tax=Cysteiniphilum litorale TaxID=2056700 RepID=UPI003F882EC3
MPVITFNRKSEVQFSLNDKFYRLETKGNKTLAIDYTCPHRGAPLFYGDHLGDKIKCPLHSNCFSKEKIEQRQLPVVSVNTTSFVITAEHNIKLLDKLMGLS